MRRYTLPEVGSVLLLASLALIVVYRAATLSVTHDEALTYELFVARGWGAILGGYHTNNHLLSSVLIKLSVDTFGLSPLTLRLPAIAGGILYIVSCFRLCRTCWGPGWYSVLVALNLVTVGYLFDFLSLARGYGLALAFLVLAIDELLRSHDIRSSIAAGICVSFYLAFVVPLAVLSVCSVALTNRARVRRLFSLAVPAAIICTLLLARPLLQSGNAGLVGHDSAVAFVRELISAWFHSAATDYRWVGTSILLAGLAAPLVHRVGEGALGKLLIIVIPISWCVSELLHRVLSFPYPAARFSMYFLPLLLLLVAHGPTRWAVVSLCGLLVLNVLQWKTSYTTEWRYDSVTDQVMNVVIRQAGPHQKVRICAEWEYEPSLNFYRVLRHAPVAPIVRGLQGPCEFVVTNDRFHFFGVTHGALLGRMSSPVPLLDDRWSGTRLHRVSNGAESLAIMH